MSNVTFFTQKYGAFFIIVLTYLVSRFLGMMYFTPHNDEIIYTQLARVMAADWQKYKFFSLHQMGEDYFEPLQFWLTSLTVDWWKSPLTGVRIWSLLMGFLGITFTQLLVVRIWNKTAAIFTGMLILASEFFFYFDSIALNEVYLYGMGSVFVYLLYVGLECRNWKASLAAALIFLAMLTTKISGQFWLVFALLLPVLAAMAQHSKLMEMIQILKQNCLYMYGTVASVVLSAKILHSFIIPAELRTFKDESWQSGLVRDVGEILEFPIKEWMSNLSFYVNQILIVELSYFFIPVLILIFGVGIWLWNKQEDCFWKYVILILLYLFSFMPLILIAKGTEIRRLGIGLYFFCILLGVTLAVAYEYLPRGWRKIAIVVILPILVGWKVTDSYASLLKWEQTEIAFRETKGWANGAGMMEMIRYVEQLPKGLLIVDAQRGHPATALHVFDQHYPQLQVIDLEQHILDKVRDLYQNVQKEGGNLYFVFDTRRRGERTWADVISNHRQLCAQKKVISKKFRNEVLKNTAIVICQTQGFTGDITPPAQKLNYMELAVKEQTELIKRNPDAILAYYNRGKLYAALKEFQKGIDDLTKVIQSGLVVKGSQVPANFRNNAAVGSQKSSEVQKVVRGNPFHDVYLARGSAYIGLGEYEKAISDLTKELEFDADNPVVYNNRGYAYKSLKQHDKALKDFNKAIEVDPHFLQSYHHRGVIYAERGKLDLACADWKYICQQGRCEDYEEAKKAGGCL
ncbi:MAG: tetratricopeptide repeat protein [SAR324 cluster bacterium]|nr:tetratricopeptide repeat protein [SAR324 cluster bacterium]